MVMLEHEYNFNRASLWIRIYDLPLKMMNHEVAEKIGMKLGVLEDVDKNASRIGWGKWLRLRIEIDVTKPLHRFVTLKEEGKDYIWED